MMNFPSSGLYAITQTAHKSCDTIVMEVEAALRGGAIVVQYRDKQPQNADHLASQLLKLCQQYRVPLLINDDVDLALRIKADGVHLGRDDGSIERARLRLGEQAIIGVSCYNSVEHAQQAQAQGATYVAFGRFFPSSSKPLALPASIETLRLAKQALGIPIVAIGGILPENGSLLLEAGADVLAVIGGLFDGQPEQAARAYQALFKGGFKLTSAL
jgi:thiamine-phosphate pyrophosphorylase